MGTLEASHRDQLVTHLKSGCADCNTFLADTQGTVALLPLTLDPITPPPEARGRLLENLAGGSRPLQIGPRKPPPRRFGFLQALAGGAIAAGIMGAIFWRSAENQRHAMASLQAQLDETRTTLQQFKASIQTQTNQLALNVQQTNEGVLHTNEAIQRTNQAVQQTSEIVLRTSQAVEMMRSPGVQMVSLQGTDAQPKAKARAYYDTEKATVHFYAMDVPPARPGNAYELWLITAKGPAKAGMFEADQASQGVAIAIPSSADKIVKFAVTEEPAAGSLKPTSAVILIGDVQ